MDADCARKATDRRSVSGGAIMCFVWCLCIIISLWFPSDNVQHEWASTLITHTLSRKKKTTENKGNLCIKSNSLLNYELFFRTQMPGVCGQRGVVIDNIRSAEQHVDFLTKKTLHMEAFRFHELL